MSGIQPVVLTGDVHSSWVAELREDFDDPTAAIDAAPRSDPRLFATAEQLRSLRTPFPAGSLKREVSDHLVDTAEKLLGAQPVKRELEGRRLLGQSRRCVERVFVLATAYHLTGDTRFAERCEKEMLAAALAALSARSIPIAA